MAPYHGGPPGSLCLHLCRVEQGWRPPPLAKMLQVMTAQELQSGRAVDLKKSTQVLGSVRSHRRIAALSACCLGGKRRECRRVSSYTSCRRGSRRRSTVRY